MKPSSLSRQTGAALIYVMTALVFIGLGVAYLARQIRLDRNVVLVENANSQALFMALSGEDWIHFRLGPAWDGKVPFTAEQFRYRVRDTVRAFQVDGGLFGARLKYLIQGLARYPFFPAHRTLRVDIGQSLELSEQPVLALLDRSASLAVGANARIQGPVLLFHGQVRKAEFTKVDYTGRDLEIEALWDSGSAAWKRLPFSAVNLSAWLQTEALQLAAAKETKGSDSLNRKGIVFRRSGLLRLGDDFHGNQAQLTAESIEMADGASCSQCVLTALKDMKIRGQVHIEGGQFLAGDTLQLDVATPVRGHAWFLTLGKSTDSASGTVRQGLLDVRNLRGEVVLFTAGQVGLEQPQWLDLRLDESVDIQGLVYSAGVATLAGRIQGAVTVHHLSVEKKGTIYINTLVNTHLLKQDPPRRIPVPIMMVGQAYLTLRRE
jgi:hypothetical protein